MKTPLWNAESLLVSAESFLFIDQKSVRTLFPAKRILKLYSPYTGKRYEEGKDFCFLPGSDRIFLTENSSITPFPESRLHPDPEKSVFFPEKGANAIVGGVDGKPVFFDERDLFAKMRLEADYEALPGTVFPVPPLRKEGHLPRFASLLREKRDLRIFLIGDSISFGSNATGKIDVPPYQPSYGELFAQELEKRTGAKVAFQNFAIGGTGCKDAFSLEEKWLFPPCDLLMVAYGMNDFARMDEKEYGQTLRRIGEKKHALDRDCEILFLSSMSGNPLWGRTPPEKAESFAKEAAVLASEEKHCGYADIYSFWQEILKKKSFYDLTGNGVNHPNDYGYRVYLTVLLALFRDIFPSE
ncbi:MAG: SGNH/GDSL hydrolase family protein [Lentisphaeria bacterium]|nr:SGNH/GDSL hydrolase family protein [Lentisphaeria bacterium]